MLLKPHRNNINEPVMVWGVTFFELATISAGSIIMLLLIIISSAFVSIPSYLIFLIPVIWGLLLRQLQKANKQGHPEYLKSWFSFKFRQPKIILIKDPTFYARKATGETQHS